MKLLMLVLLAIVRTIALLRPRLDIRPGGREYLTRWYLTPAGKGRFAKWWRRHLPGVFLHCFLASDSDRGWHSHPWHWARSVILDGEYFESRPSAAASIRWPDGQLPEHYYTDVWRHYAPGRVNTIRRGDFHKVKLLTRRVWTLFIVGPLHGDEWEFMAEDGTRTPHGTATPGD